MARRSSVCTPKFIPRMLVIKVPLYSNFVLCHFYKSHSFMLRFSPSLSFPPPKKSSYEGGAIWIWAVVLATSGLILYQTENAQIGNCIMPFPPTEV